MRTAWMTGRNYPFSPRPQIYWLSSHFRNGIPLPVIRPSAASLWPSLQRPPFRINAGMSRFSPASIVARRVRNGVLGRRQGLHGNRLSFPSSSGFRQASSCGTFDPAPHRAPFRATRSAEIKFTGCRIGTSVGVCRGSWARRFASSCFASLRWQSAACGRPSDSIAGAAASRRAAPQHLLPPLSRSLPESGRNHRDLHFVAHAFVEHRAEDNVRVLMRRVLDQRRSLVHLAQLQRARARDVDQDAPRSVDRARLQAAAKPSPPVPPPSRDSRPLRIAVPITA